jgi:hypothetical protein
MPIIHPLALVVGMACQEPRVDASPSATTDAATAQTDTRCVHLRAYSATLANSDALVREFKEAGKPDEAADLVRRTEPVRRLYASMLRDAVDRGLKCAQPAEKQTSQ